jgi:FAD/FMN-containing dehydrogenase
MSSLKKMLQTVKSFLLFIRMTFFKCCFGREKQHQNEAKEFCKIALVRNWFGNVTFTPLKTLKPMSLEDIVEGVNQCRVENIRLRAIGNLHSWSKCAEINGGCMMVMEGLNKVLEIDAKANTVTVEAGCRLIDLYNHLQKQNFALDTLPNCGDFQIGEKI